MLGYDRSRFSLRPLLLMSRRLDLLPRQSLSLTPPAVFCVSSTALFSLAKCFVRLAS